MARVAQRPAQRSGARGVVLGDRRRIGLWILPLFVLVAALAATLAGGLAVLYYGQQVSRLETTTAAARAELDEAVDAVTASADEARAAIDAQVTAVEDRLAQTAPVTVPAEAGVFAVSADHPRGETRVGSAFVLFSDADETYLATAADLVSGEAGTVESARFFVPGRGGVAARVHAVDPGLGLAVLLADGGPLPVPEWRPAGEALDTGATLFLAGVAGTDVPAVVQGRLAGSGPLAYVTDLPANEFLAGGPVLDAGGRVVAVAAPGYRPFGPTTGDLAYAVPVRLLCRELLRCSGPDLDGAAASGPERIADVPAGTRSTPQPTPTDTAPPSPAADPTPVEPQPAPAPAPPPDVPAAPQDPPDQGFDDASELSG